MYYAGWIADKFEEYSNTPPKELCYKIFSEVEVNKKEVMKYVIILQKSLMSNVLFMKREAKEVLKK